MSSFKITNTTDTTIYVINNNTMWRSYDGSANNLVNPEAGVAGIALHRKSHSDYADGVSSLAVRGPNNPSPRVVSNLICNQNGFTLNTHKLSSLMWVWGQFLDHELDLTEGDSNETANIQTLGSDPNEAYPGRTINFTRSHPVYGSNPREQPNMISSYIDGTNIYGANSYRCLKLRMLDGSGKLKVGTSDGGEQVPPYNTYGLPNASLTGMPKDSLFLCGDIRANENAVLTCMHTLFIKEHNRMCDMMKTTNPETLGKDEMAFNYARKVVNGIVQKITYNDFLPLLIGELPAYNGYKPEVDASIATEFSTFGYRLGHSMLTSTIQIGNTNSTALLRDIFFTPSFVQQNGTENILFGMTQTPMKNIDNKVIDDIRNFLFGPPTASHLLDLVTLNIQRGRDHGIPGYNAVRVAYGLPPRSFSEITSNAALAQNLQSVYTSPDYIDPWVGALCEDHHNGLPVGELTMTVLRDQFIRLRDGDRFWYENDPSISSNWKNYIKTVKLSDVLKNNTLVQTELIPLYKDNVFKY